VPDEIGTLDFVRQTPSPAPTVRRATSTKPGTSPRAGPCRSSWPTSTSTAPASSSARPTTPAVSAPSALVPAAPSAPASTPPVPDCPPVRAPPVPAASVPASGRPPMPASASGRPAVPVVPPWAKRLPPADWPADVSPIADPPKLPPADKPPAAPPMANPPSIASPPVVETPPALAPPLLAMPPVAVVPPVPPVRPPVAFTPPALAPLAPATAPPAFPPPVPWGAGLDPEQLTNNPMAVSQTMYLMDSTSGRSVPGPSLRPGPLSCCQQRPAGHGAARAWEMGWGLHIIGRRLGVILEFQLQPVFHHLLECGCEIGGDFDE
jgi:hypothetical protein